MAIKLSPKREVSERKGGVSGLVEMTAEGDVSEGEVDGEIELVVEGMLGASGGDKFALLVFYLVGLEVTNIEPGGDDVGRFVVRVRRSFEF